MESKKGEREKGKDRSVYITTSYISREEDEISAPACFNAYFYHRHRCGCQTFRFCLPHPFFCLSFLLFLLFYFVPFVCFTHTHTHTQTPRHLNGTRAAFSSSSFRLGNSCTPRHHPHKLSCVWQITLHGVRETQENQFTERSWRSGWWDNKGGGVQLLLLFPLLCYKMQIDAELEG